MLHKQQQRHAHATQQRVGRHRLSKHTSGAVCSAARVRKLRKMLLCDPARRKGVVDGITAVGTDPDLSKSVRAVWCGEIPGSSPILQLRLPARGNYPAAAAAAATAGAVRNTGPLHASVGMSLRSICAPMQRRRIIDLVVNSVLCVF
jgi:hypothetical protein